MFLLFFILLFISTQSTHAFEFNFDYVVNQFGTSNIIHVADYNNDGNPDFSTYYYFSGLPYGPSTPYSSFEIYSGNGDGAFERYSQISSTFGNTFYFFNDFNSDGNMNLISNMPSFGYNVELFDLTTEEEPEVLSTLFNPLLSYQSIIISADFDGNGLDDFVDIAPDYDFVPEEAIIHLDSGDLKFEQHEIQLPYIEKYLATDFNHDNYSDIIFIEEDTLSIFFGDSEKANIFQNSLEETFPITSAEITSVNFDLTTQETILIYNEEAIYSVSLENELVSFNPISLPVSLADDNHTFADVDQDDFIDMICWEDSEIIVYTGNGDGTFNDGYLINVPYTQITQVVVLDCNLDGQNDLLIRSERSPNITLLSKPSHEPTPVFAPTPTPTPPLPQPQATFTPYPLPAGEVVNPTKYGDLLIDLFNNVPDHSTLYFKGGHGGPGIPENRWIRISNKNLHIIGLDQNPLAGFNAYIPQLDHSTVTIQNMKISPFFETYVSQITAQNSNITLINNDLPHREDITASRYVVPAEPNIVYKNSTNKYITFIDNKIYNKTKPSLSIENCDSINIDMTQNCQFGQKGKAVVDIKNSSNIHLYLGDASDTFFPASLTQLNIQNSSVHVYGGIIKGMPGDIGVLGGKGDDALTATENSYVVLHGTELEPGAGGAGIIPGESGKDIVKDASSTVVQTTFIPFWSLY